MPDPTPRLEIPEGYRSTAVKAGIKPSGGLDLALFVCDRTSQAAGTFTTNRIAAAPVKWDRAIVPSDSIRAIVVNAGNANAATGEEGLANVRRTAERVAKKLACAPEQVLVASTGVIGRQLPIDLLEAGIDSAFAELAEGPAGFEIASRAIMTTDTRPKVVSLSRKLADGATIRLLGLAKGAAMIGPNMATMLAFLFTDARVGLGAMQSTLWAAVDETFNCLSVEGHTSTNDTVLLVGPRGGKALDPAGFKAFGAMVHEACDELARMIADDGEGATHLIRVDVRGCRDRDEARTIAKSVADDALVKTAIHGADPNWGRIVSAAGHAGVPFDEDELSLSLNGVDLFRDGRPLPFDAAAASATLKANRQVVIEMSLKRGRAEAHFWTCDLTAEYVRLNADYTT